MADFDNIKDYSEKRVGYNILQWFWGTSINRKLWIMFMLVAGIGIFIFMLHGILNQDAKLTWNKVKTGDSLYAYDGFFDDTILTHLTPYRLIRPMTEADIDTMKIEGWKKAKLKSQLSSTLRSSGGLDTSLTDRLIPAEIGLVTDSMFKNNTAYIGTYLSRDSTNRNQGGFTDRWYIFKPDLKRPTNYVIEIPNGYLLANHDYYIDASNVRLEEAKPFKKAK